MCLKKRMEYACWQGRVLKLLRHRDARAITLRESQLPCLLFLAKKKGECHRSTSGQQSNNNNEKSSNIKPLRKLIAIYFYFTVVMSHVCHRGFIKSSYLLLRLAGFLPTKVSGRQYDPYHQQQAAIQAPTDVGQRRDRIGADDPAKRTGAIGR
ncbi:hypothetical protein [Undibacterium sp.]|uniref:hypothetical protein n=1 Tax=Undibacterium sp. TaxID=1914977 RepID=UPI0025EC0455|nr:hypothetical protein [Undibacterium sp.]